MEKTYISYLDVEKRNQIEYKENTTLLDPKTGELLVKGGWARHNVFDYKRKNAKPQGRGKEWDFYQISNGKYMVQVSICNISIGGYVSAVLADISGESTKLISSMGLYLFGKNKVVLPENEDMDYSYEYKKKNYYFKEEVKNKKRIIEFKGKQGKKPIDLKFEMDLFDDHENITIVTPFMKKEKYLKTRFFLTMKQNCMPTNGYFDIDGERYEFSKDDTFSVLDWGRGVWPYRSVWYWGNGAQHIKDENGEDHIIGFEITWGIGDERNATETCIFYDGKAHKIGSVDVKEFPKPDKYMNEWHFISEDNRFNLTMTPKFDHHSDLNILRILRMHSHQVHGLFNGTLTLDDGKIIEIKDMYAFCEYVENKW